MYELKEIISEFGKNPVFSQVILCTTFLSLFRKNGLYYLRISGKPQLPKQKAQRIMRNNNLMISDRYMSKIQFVMITVFTKTIFKAEIKVDDELKPQSAILT